MNYQMGLWGIRWIALAGLLFGYFAVYPDDVQVIAAPLENLLNLTNAVSPWLYMVAGVGIIAWAVVRTWGGKNPSYNG